jgi:glycosyltransferase involved in cell wall biosynthesis
MRDIASEEDKIDAILVTKFNVLLLPVCALLAWWLNATLIYDLFVSLYRTGKMHSYPAWKVNLVYGIEQVTLRLPDILLTETGEFADLYVDLYGIPRERIVGIPIGADDMFHPREDDIFDSYTVAYWGNFLPHHGLETVVAAIDILRTEDVQFHFYGDGPLRTDIQERIHKLEVNSVTFHGRVPAEELSVAAANADVALGIFEDDPRSQASITNKVTEGVAAGTAVVTMRSPAIEEWFDDNENIVLVPPEDPDALADAIHDLRNEPARREEIARAGRQRYETVFSVEHIGELLVDTLPFAAKRNQN